MARADDDLAYRPFLRGRWPYRARLLALYAAFGTPVFVLLDWVFTRSVPSPPTLGTILFLRLPWIVIPLVGWLTPRLAPGWPGLPPLVMAISVLWAWGNDAAFFALGLAGSAVQAIAVLLYLVTTATFMPLYMRGRAAILGLMTLGHVALDIWLVQGPALWSRLWTGAMILGFALCLTVVFENFAASQRRGLRLRRELERTVAALEKARRDAEDGVAEVGLLAAAVAHDVNNPLAVVKVSVRWLGEERAGPEDREERAEVVADALSAVERISRIVAELRRRAAERADRLTGGRPPGDPTRPDAPR